VHEDIGLSNKHSNSTSSTHSNKTEGMLPSRKSEKEINHEYCSRLINLYSKQLSEEKNRIKTHETEDEWRG